MLDDVGGLFSALFDGFSGWSAPAVVVWTVSFFTIVTSLVLTSFTAGSRMFTVPVAYLLLFVSGLFTNYLGRNVHIAGATEMQVAILLTAVGQVVAGFLLLLVFKTGESKPGRG